MCLPVLRLIPILCLLACSEGAVAASEDSPDMQTPIKITIDAAQECFQIAVSVPEFRYEEIEVDLGEGEEERESERFAEPLLDSITDTENIDPCALAIQNNNLTQRDLAATYSNQGIVLAGKGEYTLAVISHTRAIDLLENSEGSQISESFYINRGNSYFAMQEYEAANADYSRAILLSVGTQHQALYNRALVFKALGYKQRALEELEHALLLAPDNPRYLASHNLLRIESEIDWEKPGETLD